MSDFFVIDTSFTLPPMVRAVVRALGLTRACEWLGDHGGRQFRIRAQDCQGQGLSADEMARLRETLAPHMDASGWCVLPKADKLLIEIRNAQIRRDRRHTSIGTLAYRHGLTSRSIINICRGLDEETHEPRQLDLFE